MSSWLGQKHLVRIAKSFFIKPLEANAKQSWEIKIYVIEQKLSLIFSLFQNGTKNDSFRKRAFCTFAVRFGSSDSPTNLVAAGFGMIEEDSPSPLWGWISRAVSRECASAVLLACWLLLSIVAMTVFCFELLKKPFSRNPDSGNNERGLGYGSVSSRDAV